MHFICHLIDASIQGVYENDINIKQYAFSLMMMMIMMMTELIRTHLMVY